MGAVPRDGVSVVGAVAADAPPAKDNDIPATPNTGTAFHNRVRFEVSFLCAIAKFSMLRTSQVTPAVGAKQRGSAVPWWLRYGGLDPAAALTMVLMQATSAVTGIVDG